MVTRKEHALGGHDQRGVFCGAPGHAGRLATRDTSPGLRAPLFLLLCGKVGYSQRTRREGRWPCDEGDTVSETETQTPSCFVREQGVGGGAGLCWDDRQTDGHCSLSRGAAQLRKQLTS